MKKRIFIYLLLLLFSLLLVACGGSDLPKETCKVTIHFDENVYERNVEKGSSIDFTSFDSGYLLVGWFSDSEYTTDVTNTKVTSDCEIYAKIVAYGEEYKITYNLNGGKFVSSRPNKYQVGEKVVLTIPVKEPLYSFVGWKLNGEFITEISETMYGDITLDANWNDIAKYYNIKYEIGEGTLKEDLLKVLRESDTYTIPEPSPTNAECFYGWYLEPTFETKITVLDKTIGKDVTLYAQYGPRDAAHSYISFLGDSLTTYAGTMPSGYAIYYPRLDVQKVEDTWWHQTTTKLGYNLLKNNSYSGSKVGGSSEYACINKNRVKELCTDDRQPDVVVVFMGSNDWAAATVATIDADAAQFKTNYNTMLDNIYECCGEDVSIYLCTLPLNNYSSGYQTMRNAFNVVIKAVSLERKLPLIDFTPLITESNLDDCYPEANNCHFNKNGMNLLANCAYEKISQIETEKFNQKTK